MENRLAVDLTPTYLVYLTTIPKICHFPDDATYPISDDCTLSRDEQESPVPVGMPDISPVKP